MCTVNAPRGKLVLLDQRGLLCIAFQSLLRRTFLGKRFLVLTFPVPVEIAFWKGTI
jgi:hypothetical protein